MSGTINRRELEASLRKYAKQFGENNAQAIARWGIQTARELAFETQVWGRSKTKAKQEAAIMADAYQVFLVVDTLKTGATGAKVETNGKSYRVPLDQVCQSQSDFEAWMDYNRDGKGKGTARLEPKDRKVITRGMFRKFLKIRLARAGMAKGAWLGTGLDLARVQTGANKITIGKNYLAYAQKHAGMGHSTIPKSGPNSSTRMTNRAAHSGLTYVLPKGKITRAQAFGLSKTVKFYRKSLAALDKKKS